MDLDERISKLHDRFVDLACVFYDTCKKAGVKCWLWGGTLLGAVREGGIIPYDDDFDICVMAEDIGKLESAEWPCNVVFGSALHSTMYALHLKGTMMINMPDKRWHECIKMGRPAGIHIDVFPIFGVPDDLGKSAAFQRIADKIPLKEAIDSYPGSKYVSSLHEKDYHVPRECFSGDQVIIGFSGKDLPIMPGYSNVLKCMYGNDYMTPKEWKGHHKQVVDLYNGWECYFSGKKRIPQSFSKTVPGNDVMFI